METVVNTETHPSARSVFRSILEGTGLYSILGIAQRLISLMLLPIATRYLTTGDYGVIGLLDNTNIVIAVLLGVQISSAFGFFYFEKNSGNSPAKVVGTTFGGALLLGVIAGGLGWIFAVPLSRLVFAQEGFATLLRISFIGLPLSFLNEAAVTWLRIEERVKMYTIAALSRILLAFVGVVIMLAWMRRGVWGMLVSNLIVGSVVTALVVGYSIRCMRLEFDWGLLKRMLRFTAPVGLSGLAMFFIHFGDVFVLPHYTTFSEVGIYGVAYKMGMAVSIIQGSFLVYWNAQVFKLIQRDDARLIFARTFTYMALILAFSAMGLVFFALPTLRIFAQPNFYGAAAIVPLLVMAYIFRSFAEFWRTLFFATNHPGLDAICIVICCAVCATGYFLLIPRWGMWGAGAATAISFAFMMVLTALWAHRLWAYELETGRLLKVLLAVSISIGIHFLIPVKSLWGEILMAILLLSIFPAVLLALRFITPAEQELINTGWSRLRSGNLPWRAKTA